MSNGKKIPDGLEDALARNVKRYTNICTIDDGRRRMTDLERATWAALRGDIPTWPAQIVDMLAAFRREGAEEARAEFADAIRAALKIGAEEMRERAAKTAESALSIAKTIRALPLTPEEPLSRDKSDE